MFFRLYFEGPKLNTDSGWGFRWRWRHSLESFQWHSTCDDFEVTKHMCLLTPIISWAIITLNKILRPVNVLGYQLVWLGLSLYWFNLSKCKFVPSLSRSNQVLGLKTIVMVLVDHLRLIFTGNYRVPIKVPFLTHFFVTPTNISTYYKLKFSACTQSAALPPSQTWSRS